MLKKLATVAFVLISPFLHAQTLFWYGNDSVTVKEFQRAYNKNNTGPKTEKAFRDYLDLYIASRLKIREAQSLGYDTLPQMVADLENLRQQILPTYINDRESVNKLVSEALARSKKDIHLAHIFISFTQKGVYDTAAARARLTEVQNEIARNGNFAELARRYSDDPAAANNGGDLDWITVFTLPYPLENLAYATPVGKVSSLYRSRAGYHLFKNLGERPDPGRIRAAQILLAFPPDDPNARDHIRLLADSIYNRLQKGDDFGKLATQFSNDVISAAANGQMQEFGIGEYDPAFTRQVFALPKDGAMAKPFLTTHGYHIVKRLGLSPQAWSASDRKSMDNLKARVEGSDRMGATKSAMAARILRQAQYKKAAFSEPELWALSDSAISFQKPSVPVQMTGGSALFQLGDKPYTVSDWISYAQAFRYKPDGSGFKTYPQLWDEFVESSAVDYYQRHLENFNEDFRQQLTEFREGNLFFEIMQRQVWGPAQSDSDALQHYYDAHRNRYNWNESADAVIFYASDLASANAFRMELKKNPSNWRALTGNFSEKIAADSARFELAQLPNGGKVALTAGTITTPFINKSDNTASFTYVIRPYGKGGTRSFAEARGLVINDYQNELEQQWIAELKKKYPVRMNEAVLSELLKKK